METTYTLIERSCGHTSQVVLASGVLGAAEDIVALKTSTCPPCTRKARQPLNRILWNDPRGVN